MDVLPLHFRTLRYFGLWRDSENQHRLVTYIWKPFVINAILFFTILQLAVIKVYWDNMKALTECIYLSLTYLGLCLKLLNFLWRQDTLNQLLDEFRADIFRSRNAKELDIIAKREKMISIFFHLQLGVSHLSGIAFYFLPLLSLIARNNEIFLPFKTYEIYNKENSAYYSIKYVFQVVAAVISISVHVALDTMLGSFVLLTCCQIDLCCYRFASSCMNKIKKSTKDYIVHQLLIRRIVRKLESFFMRVVVPHMLLSLFTLCTSIYNISQIKIGDAELVFHLIYLAGLLSQLFGYSLLGSELKMKGIAIRETIYNSDWTVLKPLDRKSLYFVMLSCQNEMSISFHGTCTISLEIFVWILKTSYAAYNLLKSVDD